MKKLDCNEYYVCRLQAKVFEASLTKSNTSSPVFIRRFMNSNIARAFDNKTIMMSPLDINNILDIIDEEYGTSSYGKVKYDNNEIYWIGYFYRVLSFYLDISSKTIYKIFPLKEIKSYYYIGHTFDPEKAAENIIESKHLNEDLTAKGVEILKRLTLEAEQNR